MNRNDDNVRMTLDHGDLTQAKRLCDIGYKTFLVRNGTARTLGTVRPANRGYDITRPNGMHGDDGTSRNSCTHIDTSDAIRLYNVVAGNDDDTAYSHLACDGITHLDLSSVDSNTPDGRYYC